MLLAHYPLLVVVLVGVALAGRLASMRLPSRSLRKLRTAALCVVRLALTAASAQLPPLQPVKLLLGVPAVGLSAEVSGCLQRLAAPACLPASLLRHPSSLPFATCSGFLATACNRSIDVLNASVSS